MDARINENQLKAFAFMRDRPFDLLVSVRFYSDSDMAARQVHIYYSEGGMTSSFEYDMADAQYAGSPEALISAAVKQLVTEIKSRIRSKDDFRVWFYTKRARDAVIEWARLDFSDNEASTRYVDLLVERATLANRQDV